VFEPLESLVGGFNHLEKYESQWGGLSHIFWKIKNVPNHQPDHHLSEFVPSKVATWGTPSLSTSR